MQRDNLQGVRGRRSGTIGTLGRPPPYPLAVFPLHSLSPNPQPPPGHRYAVSGKFSGAYFLWVFCRQFSERASRSCFVGALIGRTMCAPTEKMRKTLNLFGKMGKNRDGKPVPYINYTPCRLCNNSELHIPNSEFNTPLSLP